MPSPPLSTPLSQLLVAFTIELDDEFERRMAAAAPGRFRVSVVMWSNFLRFVGDGLPVGELPEAAGLPKARVLSTLGGMERWRYVFVAPESIEEPPDEKRDGYGSARGLRPEWVVRPTPTGRAAQQLWPPLFSAIEARWEERFGTGAVASLRQALRAVADGLDVELPEYLPVVTGTNGMVAEVAGRDRRGPASERLLVLLAQTLLAYTLTFERESELSLPLSENVVRVLDETGTDVRELPAAAGISKEAVTMALTFLTKHGFVEVDAKRVHLASKGAAAQAERAPIHAEAEGRFGDAAAAIRAALQPLLDRPSAIAEGLRPHPGGWRGEAPYLAQTQALLADPLARLPHYPLVLHRGGWPDGS